MAFTSHGFHIRGTVLDDPPEKVFRCGGPGRCASCTNEAAAYNLDVKIPTQRNQKTDYQELAKTSLVRYFQEHGHADYLNLTENQVYIVWFAKTLQNWKALVCTMLEDDMYYELTYNGDKSELYIDSYKKLYNTVLHGVR